MPLVEPKDLIERTVDLPSYLHLLDFEGIKAIATHLSEQCLKPEKYSIELF